MRAKIYIRVSTDEQVKGYSLDAQEELCQQYIKSQGWSLEGIFKDDGYSAKDLKRPAMQQLIKEVEEKKFDVLVVYRLDRLVRSVMDLHYLLGMFNRYGVKFKSVSEVFDTTTAMGRLFISIIGSLAQWERENLAERCRVGSYQKFLVEGRSGGRPPYGYSFDENGKLIINEKEAAIVREIFQLYLKMGAVRIAAELNRKGYKTRKNQFWTEPSVRYIIRNPVYIGKNRWGYNPTRGGKKIYYDEEGAVVQDGEHEPIISKELWDEVQELQRKRREIPSRAPTSDYPFSGVLSCGRCGSPLTGYKKRYKKSVDYKYVCTRRKIGKCDLPFLSEIELEKELFRRIDWIIDTNSFKPPDLKEKTKKEEIEKELARIRSRKKKWQIAYADDVITLEELKERTAEDREREKALLDELEKITVENREITKEDFEESLNDLTVLWELATRYERKQMIHSIFTDIVVDTIRDNSYSSVKGKRYPVEIVEVKI